MRVERLPFTVYDILGYFIPGALLLAGLCQIFPISRYLTAHITLPQLQFAANTLVIATAVAGGYALGHIVSLLASWTIEKLIVWLFGYPSVYLLRAEKKCRFDPRPLGDLAQEQFKIKFEQVFKCKYSDYEGKAWFEMVDHYIRNKNFQASARMYNYVVLYGFLRNISCASIILFLALLFQSLRTSEWHVLILLTLLAISFFTISGFQKYYRRYSREALMAFAVGVSDSAEDSKQGSPAVLL